MSAGRSRGGPCFRRDDRRHTSASSRHVSPELCPFVCPRKSRGRRECRGVRCPRGLVRKKVESDAHEHTGSAETLRHSLRDGLTAYAKLAPATNSVLVTVADGLTAGSYRLVRLRLRRLDISHGCQAHMVLPYAANPASPKGFAGHGAGRPHAVSAHGQARPATTTRAQRCRVHRNLLQRSRRRPTPLLAEQDGRILRVIWVENEAECFFARDWTGGIALIWLKKIEFTRRAIVP